eukprot:scaffold910_cov396-Prasinococcus_capsulatus_cf.AAC.22
MRPGIWRGIKSKHYLQTFLRGLPWLTLVYICRSWLCVWEDDDGQRETRTTTEQVPCVPGFQCVHVAYGVHGNDVACGSRSTKTPTRKGTQPHICAAALDISLHLCATADDAGCVVLQNLQSLGIIGRHQVCEGPIIELKFAHLQVKSERGSSLFLCALSSEYILHMFGIEEEDGSVRLNPFDLGAMLRLSQKSNMKRSLGFYLLSAFGDEVSSSATAYFKNPDGTTDEEPDKPSNMDMLKKFYQESDDQSEMGRMSAADEVQPDLSPASDPKRVKSCLADCVVGNVSLSRYILTCAGDELRLLSGSAVGKDAISLQEKTRKLRQEQEGPQRTQDTPQEGESTSPKIESSGLILTSAVHKVKYDVPILRVLSMSTARFGAGLLVLSATGALNIVSLPDLTTIIANEIASTVPYSLPLSGCMAVGKTGQLIVTHKNEVTSLAVLKPGVIATLKPKLCNPDNIGLSQKPLKSSSFIPTAYPPAQAPSQASGSSSWMSRMKGKAEAALNNAMSGMSLGKVASAAEANELANPKVWAMGREFQGFASTGLSCLCVFPTDEQDVADFLNSFTQESIEKKIMESSAVRSGESSSQAATTTQQDDALRSELFGDRAAKEGKGKGAAGERKAPSSSANGPPPKPSARTPDEIREKYGRPRREANEVCCTSGEELAESVQSLRCACFQIKEVMGRNQELLAQRGEKLSRLQDKTSDMENEAANFAEVCSRPTLVIGWLGFPRIC